ncbi:hypothetical protein LINPERHAP1_LOCUS37657 [Linum perenne]
MWKSTEPGILNRGIQMVLEGSLVKRQKQLTLLESVE